MIIPNLMVKDIHQSLAFYKDLLGMEIVVLVSPEREVSFEGNGKGAAFATLEWKGTARDNGSTGGQLMLQTVQSLSDELPSFSSKQTPRASGTIYFRGFAPDKIINKVPEHSIVKGPLQQWYGMKELYLKDPDGYIICLGIPEGSSPE